MGPHFAGGGGLVPDRAPAGPLSGPRQTASAALFLRSADLFLRSADGPRLSGEFSLLPSEIGGEPRPGAAPAFRSGVAQGLRGKP